MGRALYIALVLALYLCTSLAGLASPNPTAVVTAQGIEVTVTNTTNTTAIMVRFSEVVVYNFSAVNVRIGYIDVDLLRIVYTCIYNYNYTEECQPIEVKVYNDTVLVKDLNFTDLDAMCNSTSSLEGLCNYYYDINVSDYAKIVIEVYNATSGELLERCEVPKYEYAKMLKGYLAWLVQLIPIALLIGLAGRGSVKSIGIGLICFGVAIELLFSLGFVPPYAHIVFTLAIVMGLILVFVSEK